MLEQSLEDIPASERRRLALTATVVQIGAIAVSRAIVKTDAALADEVLHAVQQTVEAAHEVKRRRSAD